MNSTTHIRNSIIAVLTACIAVSCNKDTDYLINKTADEIEGYYSLISIDWKGDPVDVNNDGKVEDIYTELMSLPGNEFDFWAALMPWGSPNRDDGFFSFYIPTQYIRKDYLGNYPNGPTSGMDFYMFLTYEIDNTGALSFEHFTSFDSSGMDRIEIIKMKDGDASLDSDILSFEVTYTLYDHITKKLVEGRIKYNYQKNEFFTGN